jgi:hypothetical protein
VRRRRGEMFDDAFPEMGELFTEINNFGRKVERGGELGQSGVGGEERQGDLETTERLQRLPQSPWAILSEIRDPSFAVDSREVELEGYREDGGEEFLHGR